MKFRIDASHPCLPGHFPGNPIVPGVVLLDRVCAAIDATQGEGPLRLPQVKFLQPLLPEQEAEVELHAVDATPVDVRTGAARATDGAAPQAGSAQTSATPQRWRFRVFRGADGVPLATGEALRP